MKMQKLLALVLALVMVLALAACGKDKEADTTTAATTTAAPTTEAPTTAAPTTAAPTTAPAEDSTPDIQEPTTDETKSVVGTWAVAMTLSGAEIGIEGFNGNLAFGYKIVFDADGTGYTVSDDSVLEASLEENREDLANATLTVLSAEAEDAEEITFTGYEEVKAALLELTSVTEENVEKGTWSVDGTTLTFDEGTEDEGTAEITFDGDDLILKGDYMALFFGAEEVRFTPAN